MSIAKILLPLFMGIHTFHIISIIHYIHTHSLGVNMGILLTMKCLRTVKYFSGLVQECSHGDLLCLHGVSTMV